MTNIKSLQNKAHALIHGEFNENICFLHIPKCAGTSIDHAIKFIYKNENRIATVNASASTMASNIINHSNFPYDTSDDYNVLKFRENLLLYFMSNNMKYISGHFSFSETGYKIYSDKYIFITVLRDPVKRWFSLYFFNRYKDDKHCKLEDDITTFIESESGISQGYEYVKFIGGADSNRDYTSQLAIDRAKKNLSKFSIVGILENQGIFLQQIRNRFGVSLNIPKKNRNPKSVFFKKNVITKEVEDKIKQICKPDLEIYNYAVENFMKLNA